MSVALRQKASLACNRILHATGEGGQDEAQHIVDSTLHRKLRENVYVPESASSCNCPTSGVGNQLAHVLDFEFVFDTRAVSIHRLCAEMKLAGDLLGGESLADQAGILRAHGRSSCLMTGVIESPVACRKAPPVSLPTFAR
mgnify:CR=1 FL=1